MNKKAIVIGATGLVGSSLVKQLIDSDHIGRIVTLTRREIAYSSSKIVNHAVDFEKLDKYKSLFEGDLFFSCLGTTLKTAGSIEAQRKVDLDYQLKAAELAAENGVSHYLLVSSSAANHRSKNQYLKMKGELEEKVKSLPFKRISIFQPSLLLGDRGEFRFGEKLGGLFLPALKFIPILRKYRPISGDQVAAKMAEVSQNQGDGLEWYKLDEIFL